MVTPAESAERERLVEAEYQANREKNEHWLGSAYGTYWSRWQEAKRALAAFDAAHKGEG